MEHVKRKTIPSGNGNVVIAPAAHNSMFRSGMTKADLATAASVVVVGSSYDDAMFLNSHARKNRRKNIPTKTVSASSTFNLEEMKSEAHQITVDEDNSSCAKYLDDVTEINFSGPAVKSQSMRSSAEENCNFNEPIDLSISNAAQQKPNGNKLNSKMAPQLDHHQVVNVQHNLLSLAEQMGLRLPLNLSSFNLNQPPLNWNNMIKTESRNEWRAILQQIVDHLQIVHCKLTEALTLINSDHPISHFYMTDVQSAVHKLFTELETDMQKIEQFQCASEVLPSAAAMHNGARNIDYTKQMAALNAVVQQIGMLQSVGDTANGRSNSSSNTPRQMHHVAGQMPSSPKYFLSDMSSADEPPFKKKKKDPRCQDDEEANYVDPMWEPIIVYNDNVECVKFSHNYDVEMPRSKFEELLLKASSSSTRLLRVLMKHFFSHEQLAAGSLTGEGVYKDKLDENITKAIREIVSKRHPKLKKAKINLCCTDVCVQARRVNENQRRRVTRGGSLLEFPEDSLEHYVKSEYSPEEDVNFDNGHAFCRIESHVSNGAANLTDVNNN